MKPVFEREQDAHDHIEVMKDMSSDLSPEKVPDYMKTNDQWVCWKWKVSKTSKGYSLTKVPVDVNGGNASTTDRATWNTFDNVIEASQENEKIDGIGYVFNGNSLIGVDFDNCINEDKQISPDVKEIIDEFDTYMEASPSKTGLKVWGLANMPDEIVNKSNGAGSGFKLSNFPKEGMDVEVYYHSRFFTVTTLKLNAKPAKVENIQGMIDLIFDERQKSKESKKSKNEPVPKPAEESKTEDVEVPKPKSNNSVTPVTEDELLSRIRASRQGATFNNLWEGKFSNYPSQSEADLALTSILCWWCQGDRTKAEGLFAKSGLVREKWTDREDYRDGLWEMADSGDYYMPKELTDPKDLVPILSLERQIDVVADFIKDHVIEDVKNIRYDGYKVVADFEFKGEIYPRVLFSDIFCVKFDIPPMSTWKRDDKGKFAGKKEKDYWVKINNAASKVVGNTGGWGALRNRHMEVASKLGEAMRSENND